MVKGGRGGSVLLVVSLRGGSVGSGALLNDACGGKEAIECLFLNAAFRFPTGIWTGRGGGLSSKASENEAVLLGTLMVVGLLVTLCLEPALLSILCCGWNGK